jgi:hypothetical protein
MSTTTTPTAITTRSAKLHLNPEPHSRAKADTSSPCHGSAGFTIATKDALYEVLTTDRLVPLWPADRMIELAPLFWARTRARLNAKQLAAELGVIDIPVEPLDLSAASEQQAAAS